MFFSFEGIDGSGKSTQIQLLAARLQAADHPVLVLREPGGTPLAEHIRRLLLDPALDMTPMAELLLFSAARAQLVAEKIQPALAAGTIVLCDRFYDSTTAYQGAGRGVMPVDWIQAFNLKVTAGLVPARTYWVDVSLETAQQRMAQRLGETDRMEGAGRAFYERVQAAYATLAEKTPERFCRIAGEAAPEEIHATIWEDLVHHLP